MSQRPIDFCSWLRQRVAERLRAAGEIDEDAAEALAQQVYSQWVDEPQHRLGGLSVRAWFAAIQTPEELIELLRSYEEFDLEVPELLLERIEQMGAACAFALSRLARSQDDGCAQSRATALEMLFALDADAAAEIAVESVCAAQQSDPMCECAAQRLSQRASCAARERLLAAYETAPEFAQMLILEILCNFPGDERIYKYVRQMLINRPDQRAFAARLLGKLGDERGIDPLRALLAQSDLSYFEYMEIRNAIEELGGDAGPEREFYGDPDYEYMRNLE